MSNDQSKWANSKLQINSQVPLEGRGRAIDLSYRPQPQIHAGCDPSDRSVQAGGEVSSDHRREDQYLCSSSQAAVLTIAAESTRKSLG